MAELPREHIFRTSVELEVADELADIFASNPDSTSIRLENFPKYVRRVHLKRFLALYEIYKMILPVKGSIVECGVFRGFGLMSWAKLSAILEPENLTRRIYGLDTFDGFPAVVAQDSNSQQSAQTGDLRANSHDELLAVIEQFDRDRYLGHIPKVQLVKGDINETAAKLVRDNPHLMISLLFIDCDLYEPTAAALRSLVPRMPKGALLVFDELDNPIWPGETQAVLDEIGLNLLKLERLEWDPYISFARIGA